MAIAWVNLRFIVGFGEDRVSWTGNRDRYEDEERDI